MANFVNRRPSLAAIRQHNSLLHIHGGEGCVSECRAAPDGDLSVLIQTVDQDLSIDARFPPRMQITDVALAQAWSAVAAPL